MSSFRRRLLNTVLLTQSDKYVTDGLVLWLDAIDALHSTAVWEDLSPEHNVFTMVNVETKNDSRYFNGSAYGYIADPSTVTLDVLRGGKERTIEVVCRLDNSTQLHTIFLGAGAAAGTSYAAGLWYRAMSNGFKVNTLTSSPALTKPTLRREGYSITYGLTNFNDFDMKHNGESVEHKTSNEGNMFNNNISIGARINNDSNNTPQYFMKGEICAVRVYNRNLTNEERLHNLTLDKERFGF